ncbi:MFS general substrate transporter [Apiospora sp. TS-2023a]
MACVPCVVAGALKPTSAPIYEQLGPHKALTIPAAPATILTPVPFVLYKYDARIHGMNGYNTRQ